MSSSRSASDSEAAKAIRSMPRRQPQPMTVADVEEELDGILYAVDLLTQLKDLNRHVAVPEVCNLREAFRFAVGEEEEIKKLNAKMAMYEARRRAVQPGKGNGGKAPPEPAPEEEEAEAEDPKGSARFVYERSAKAQEADRKLTALEEYVKSRPVSWSYEAQARLVNWRSILHTPLDRRIQILVVFLHNFFTGILFYSVVTVLLLLCRYTAPFMIMYLVYIFTLDRPKWPVPKKVKAARWPIWRYFRDYFPIRLVVPPAVRAQFDASKNYMFCYHPHGIHGFGAINCFGLDANDCTRIFPGLSIHLQTLGVNYYVPFWREGMKLLGAGDASKACIRATLRHAPGESVLLVVGGAEESLMSAPHSNDLLLLKRKGFIKIALQEGSPLVPVYGFGENNIYKVPFWAKYKWVQYLSRECKRYTGFALPTFRGRGFFTSLGLLPFRRPVVVVVGAPLNVPKIANPTAEELDHWQGKYIAALQDLYEANRGVYDLTSTGLRIMK